MPLSASDRLGPYEILAPLGAGGMGEVYRARDTRLNRNVALKVLPDDFARDPGRRQRFEQEARAVAALNHPNIVAVYDVGENFLVSELVIGQTLRAAGKQAERQAIDLAVQIAQGIAAAHAAGITHRDLKPDNIMVTREGRAKILDFGLAKIRQPREPSSPASEASTQTQEGQIAGTVGYMAPEQVKGLPVDSRSDIFSFGLVLYEMLTGKRAFTGGSSIEVMSAILKEEPPELPESVSPALKRIVEHCLEKDPDQRFQSARDLAFALQAPTLPATVPRPGLPAPRWRWSLTAAGAVAIAAAAIIATRLLFPVPAPLLWNGVMLGGAEMSLNSRLSPDGHLLAFAAMVDGLTQVAVMKPESGNWTALTHDRSRGQAFHVSWSPDGTVIYYDRSIGVLRGVFSVPVLGGDERPVLDNASHPEALPDGSLIVIQPDAERKPRLHRFWPASGRLQDFPVQAEFTPSQNSGIRAFPDGKTALILARSIGEGTPASPFGLYAMDVSSGSMKRLNPPGVNPADIAAFAPAADGKSVIAAVNAGTLTRITSFRAGAATEQPLFTVTSNVWYLDAGTDGSVYASVLDRPSELTRFQADGSREERLASFPLVPEDASIMTVLPDGRAIVAVRASGQNRLMLVQKGKDPSVLVNTTEETMAPLAMCGSREVAFMIGPAPHQTIAFTEPESGRIVRRIVPGKGAISSIACSPDGATLYFSALRAIWSVASSGGEARNIRAGDRVIADPSGRRLIVQEIENARMRFFSMPLDGSPEREIQLDRSIPLSRSLSTGALRADGRLLVPLAPPDSWFNPPAVMDTATGRITRIPSDNQSDYRSMGWTPDGQVIALKNGLRATLWRFRPSAH